MRLAITIARLHGEPKFEVLSGPEIAIGQQIFDFKEMTASTTHPDFAEVQVWESGKGKSKEKRFRIPPQVPPAEK